MLNMMEIPAEQAGFRKGRGIGDQIFNLQMLLQKKVPANIPIYIAFIDYRKAFDSVSYQKMLRYYTLILHSNAVILNPSFSLAISRFLLTITTP